MPYRRLRDEGIEVKGMVSIFTYGFDQARDAFAEAKVNLHALTNYSVLLDQALRSDYITEKDVVSLNEWRKDPANWDVVKA
jgi:orotate phosphoribosyltransferase